MSEIQGKSKFFSTRNLVQLALLTAIIILMSFTPIGYLRTPVVEITFITVPVVVGAIIIGPAAGAFLGGVFGLTSFIQCFGMSPFGATLLSINPVFTFILCMVPRVLMGWLCGLIFRALSRSDKTRLQLLAYGVGALSGPVLNTVLFVLFLIVLFGGTDYIRGFGSSIPAIIVTIVGLNGVIEAVVCTIIGAAVSKALAVALGRLRK